MTTREMVDSCLPRLGRGRHPYDFPETRRSALQNRRTPNSTLWARGLAPTYGTLRNRPHLSPTTYGTLAGPRPHREAAVYYHGSHEYTTANSKYAD